MAVPRRTTERRIIRHLRPASVARIAFFLSLSVAAIFVVGLIALYVLGWASGALDGFEGFMEDLGFEGFRVSFFGYLPVVLLFSLGTCAAVTAVAVAFAGLYNALSELVGGVEIDVRER